MTLKTNKSDKVVSLQLRLAEEGDSSYYFLK